MAELLGKPIMEHIVLQLRRCGFEVLRCADSLLDDGHHGSTCYIIAKKL